MVDELELSNTMIYLLSISAFCCLLLVGCLKASAAVPPSLVFSVSPPTNFTLYGSANLSTPKTNWQQIASGTNSLTVPLTSLAGLTNPPTYSQHLAWNKSGDPLVTGYYVYYGGASVTYTNRVMAPMVNADTNGDSLNPNPTNLVAATNLFVRGLDNGVHYYAATCFNSNGLESPFSVEVSAMPNTDAVSTVVYFYAKANVATRLSISQ